jgi:hypothetical protein
MWGMEPHDERSLDNMVESLLGQIALDGPLAQSLENAPRAKALLPLVFTIGHTIEALYRQIGLLDARIVALENR